MLRVLDDWRQQRGLGHRAFCRFIGRDKTEWAHARAGRRGLSDSFVRAAREQMAAVDGGWVRHLDAAIQVDAVARVVAA